MTAFKSIYGNFKSFTHLLGALESLPKKHSTLLVGIDGCGGSGKSTFAKKLADLSPAIMLVHMDDFYLPSNLIIKGDAYTKPIGADFDWPRLRDQLLDPISAEKNGVYQRYDWCTDTIAEWHLVPTGGIVLVEGVYSTRQELSHYYDFKVWVDCPSEIRLARGIQRDGEASRELWEKNWMVAENKYVEEHRPFERADLVIDGSGNM
ncbi:MAG: uridine kinase [Clostridia bacterium]|nr:uridine kinase [Clostridia bacterium]